MKLRIIKLFILCLLFLSFTISVWGNSVSGVYTVPLNSVKFEKKSHYSILPVGWSKKGNAAFVIIDKEKSTHTLFILDTVIDKVLWTSSPTDLNGRSLSTLWSKKSDLFSENLSRWDIIPNDHPQYGGLRFSFGGDDFKLYSEETLLTANRGIAALTLNIESQLRGNKSLYKYVHDSAKGNTLVSFHVLGYFQSPWEKRIAVLSVSDFQSSENEDFSELKFSGAHLGIGYKRIESTESMLIESVLSGQFYNTRQLLLEGENPDTTIPTGTPLILMAAKQNNWDLVFLLIDYKADIAVIDGDKRTLLHYGAELGDVEAVRKLILLGINKDFKDVEGDSALSLALENDFIDVVNLLE